MKMHHYSQKWSAGIRYPAMLALLVCCLATVHSTPAGEFTHTRWSGTEVVAPDFVVKGKVVDDSGIALPGATIAVKGTTNGTVTDGNGTFALRLPDAMASSAVLVVTYTGYITREIAVNGKNELSIVLSANTLQLGDLVVIGYGSQSKKDLTGSVGQVNVQSVTKLPTNDLTKAIQGQVAGVSVHGGGEPGATPQIKIRGIGSFNNNNPLFIIDGVQSPVNDVPTSDIETIQILKDASAAAIYGSRAANGVVIITTKRGREGKLRVDYDVYRGTQSIPTRYEVANREEYQLLVNEASANAEPALPVKPANDPSSPLYVDDVDTDWQQEAFRNGSILSQNLGVSGGTEAAKFSISLNHYDHTGTIAGNGPAYTRYGFRVNSDFKQGRFKFGESFGYTKVDQNFMTFVHTGTNLGYIVNAIPTLPVYDASTVDGFGSASQTIHGSYTANAIGFNSLIDSKTDRYRIIGNIYGEYQIWDALKYRLSLGYERTDWRDFNFQPVHDLGWFYVNNIAKMNDWRGSGYTGTIENTLNWDKIAGPHNISLLAGQSVLQSEISRISGHAEGFTQPYFKVLSNGSSGVTVTGYDEKNRLLSYFGRAIYSYDNKYLLTATVRRDGSSRFSSQHRWGTFPSVAAGWKVHNESFMENQNLISQLKLRASYGILGNQEIPPYQYEALVNPYSHAVFSNQLAVGATQVEFATPDIKWEEKISKNIGVDLGFMDDRLTVSAEYYDNVSQDMLLRVRIPESTGVYPWKSPYINGASVRNSGFELTANYSDNRSELTYSIGANFSTLKNEVLSLGYGDKPIAGGITRTEVGGEVGALYGWVIDGIFQTQEEIDALNTASPIGRYQEVLTRPGDIRFSDINGRDADGNLTDLPDGKIDDDDRTYLGSAIPNLYFGLNFSLGYNGFDFSALANGVSGNLIYNTIRAGLESGAGWDNYAANSLNRWTPANTNTDVPRVVMFDPNKNGRASSRWLEKGDYFRLTTVQLGYTLPENTLSKKNAARVRIYVTGQNLVTLTKYTGFDPDFGNDGLFEREIDMGNTPNRPFTAFSGGLPNPRGFLAGVQIGF
jgi:TonB-linked SusC/RagA family outer membrane protein